MEQLALESYPLVFEGLPFPAPLLQAAVPPSPPITTLDAVRQFIARLAIDGLPIPHNDLLSKEIGRTRSTLRDSLRRLVAAGHIEIEIQARQRRIRTTDPASNWTGWGMCRSIPKPSKVALAARPTTTQLMFDVLRVVTRIARAAGPMPNNPVLGDLAGGRGRSSALRALRRLVRIGSIVVEHAGSQRRCRVVESGEWTSWGEARPGHVPFLHRRRGEPTAQILRPAKRRPSRSIALKAHILPPVRGYAATCQYPGWKDDEKAGREPIFCDNPSEQDGSFCAEHMTLCFPHRKPPKPRPKIERRDRRVITGTLIDNLSDGDLVEGNRFYTTEALFR